MTLSIHERQARRRARRRAWAKANPEKVKAQRRACRRRNPARYKAEEQRYRAKHGPKRLAPVDALFHAAKSRARAKGLPFAITKQHITVPATCPVLGIRIARTAGQAKDSSPSLDRINPSLGYVPGNVIVVSKRANQIKSDATAAELRAVAEFYTTLAETATWTN